LLPFANDFFDAVVSIDSFVYYGSDQFYLNYIAHFVKPGGPIAIAGAGLTREIEGEVPPHLEPWFTGEGLLPEISRLVAKALGTNRHLADGVG
jgi:cyclopropane fatty-acyl-phospholipid synthase-like methyltransferase